MRKNREEINEIAMLKMGARIKEFRENSYLTLEELAAQTDIDREVLSRIENSEFFPPLATLLKLANALDVEIVNFLQGRASVEKISITRRNERVRIGRRPHHRQGEVDYIYEALEIKQNFRHMDPFMVEFPLQDISEMVFNSHEGEEFLHVFKGTVEFRSTDRQEVLMLETASISSRMSATAFEALAKHPPRRSR